MNVTLSLKLKLLAIMVIRLMDRFTLFPTDCFLACSIKFKLKTAGRIGVNFSLVSIKS